MSMSQATNLGEVLAHLAQDPRVRDLEVSPDEAEAFAERVVDMAKYRHAAIIPMDEAMQYSDDSLRRHADVYKDLADL